jgi:hypothetical protein
MYINKKGSLLGNTFVSILQLGVRRGVSIGGSASMFPKIADGPMNMALSKKKKL